MLFFFRGVPHKYYQGEVTQHFYTNGCVLWCFRVSLNQYCCATSQWLRLKWMTNCGHMRGLIYKLFYPVELVITQRKVHVLQCFFHANVHIVQTSGKSQGYLHVHKSATVTGLADVNWQVVMPSLGFSDSPNLYPMLLTQCPESAT